MEAKLTLGIDQRFGSRPGFVAVDERCHHPNAEGDGIGVTVAQRPVEETPIAVNLPKTGHMTEQMATIAANDFATRIMGNHGASESHALFARCFLDMGSRGVYLSVDPVRPPRNKIPTVPTGRQWLGRKVCLRGSLPVARSAWSPNADYLWMVTVVFSSSLARNSCYSRLKLQKRGS